MLLFLLCAQLELNLHKLTVSFPSEPAGDLQRHRDRSGLNLKPTDTLTEKEGPTWPLSAPF